jgi:hypothetical protein
MSYSPIDIPAPDLDTERLILLSEEDAEIVFELVENPPEPNEKLVSAARKHREFFSENSTNSESVSRSE